MQAVCYRELPVQEDLLQNCCSSWACMVSPSVLTKYGDTACMLHLAGQSTENIYQHEHPFSHGINAGAFSHLASQLCRQVEWNMLP